MDQDKIKPLHKMKKTIIFAFLMWCGTTFSQTDTTKMDSVSVTLEARELAYTFTALGKLPAERVELLRSSVARQVNGQLPQTGSISIKLTKADIKLCAEAMQPMPIQEAFLLLVKYLKIIEPRWDKIFEILKE